jgi:hypothetical protein
MAGLWIKLMLVVSHGALLGSTCHLEHRSSPVVQKDVAGTIAKNGGADRAAADIGSRRCD